MARSVASSSAMAHEDDLMSICMQGLLPKDVVPYPYIPDYDSCDTFDEFRSQVVTIPAVPSIQNNLGKICCTCDRNSDITSAASCCSRKYKESYKLGCKCLESVEWQQTKNQQHPVSLSYLFGSWPQTSGSLIIGSKAHKWRTAWSRVRNSQ